MCVCVFEESITSQKLGARDIWGIANSVLNKSESTVPPLFNSLEMLSSASDKETCILKTFLRTLILMTQVSFYLLFLRTNLRLHIMAVSPTLKKKFIADIDSSKASGPDGISLLTLQSCKPELYTNQLPFSIYVSRNLVFQIFGRCHLWSTAKNFRLVGLLSAVSKIF